MITDELREYVQDWRDTPSLMDDLDRGDIDGILEDFLRIADRIDIAHKHAIGYVDDRDPETMAEHGWVRLPVDADGVPIHIGDRMENNERVARIVLTDDDWEPSVYLEKLPNVLQEHFCHEISHYHAPTVEDVLDEFVERWHDTHHDDIPALKAEYAAKLQLKKDA